MKTVYRSLVRLAAVVGMLAVLYAGSVVAASWLVWGAGVGIGLVAVFWVLIDLGPRVAEDAKRPTEILEVGSGSVTDEFPW